MNVTYCHITCIFCAASSQQKADHLADGKPARCQPQHRWLLMMKTQTRSTLPLPLGAEIIQKSLAMGEPISIPGETYWNNEFYRMFSWQMCQEIVEQGPISGCYITCFRMAFRSESNGTILTLNTSFVWNVRRRGLIWFDDWFHVDLQAIVANLLPCWLFSSHENHGSSCVTLEDMRIQGQFDSHPTFPADSSPLASIWCLCTSMCSHGYQSAPWMGFNHGGNMGICRADCHGHAQSFASSCFSRFGWLVLLGPAAFWVCSCICGWLRLLHTLSCLDEKNERLLVCVESNLIAFRDVQLNFS